MSIRAVPWLAIVMVAGPAFAAESAASRTTPAAHRPLTFEDRVAAQRAIEQVYWNHRIWPKDNPGPKPPLSAVMSDEAIRVKVEDYLKKSNALQTWWSRPITTEQLQAEIDRMARGTHDPHTLKELFAALGNDPCVIAETLSRQTLADRLIRNWYANDTRFHADVRAEAEAALKACSDMACLKTMGGEYRETTLRLRHGEAGADESRNHGDRAMLAADQWRTAVDRLAARFGAAPKAIPTGRLSPLIETSESFNASVVVSQGADAITIATIAWPKEPFETWWAGRRASDALDVSTPAGHLELPKLAVGVCTDGTWERTRQDFPDARDQHTAVWTGTEMIVWGGENETALNSGARYEAATDTWLATSMLNAPEARFGHTAIWTGTEMIVWGGGLNTGGRYNPSSDSWTPTSSGDSVPDPRFSHTAVWTGSEMIIWGGSADYYGYSCVGTGGRYDPAADTWTATSTDANVPGARRGHTAVWTGAEMIIWGGFNLFPNGIVNHPTTGGRYDPSTDSWTPTSTGMNTPHGRNQHTAVWTGTAMLVWGGVPLDFPATGGRYDPSTDTWAPIAAGPTTPTARMGHGAVWTGTEMIVWGGNSSTSTSLNSGGRYNPTTNTWRSTSTGANLPIARRLHSSVWTGTEMIVWGGSQYSASPFDSGGRYSPSTDNWVPTSVGGTEPSPRSGSTSVWTGSELVIWGGATYDGTWVQTDSGGRFNPSTDSWIPTSRGAGMATARVEHTATWTGTEMIIWGGLQYPQNPSPRLNSGGRYNPLTDSWATMSAGLNTPEPRSGHTAVWTGSQLIVWGGSNGTNGLSSGGRYDPVADHWEQTAVGGSTPSAREYHSAIWTGTRMIVWGGLAAAPDSYPNSGGGYDPLSDTWTPTSLGPNVPIGREFPTAVWTGGEMIVWGGYNNYSSGDYYLNSGGRYDPVSDSWVPTSTGANVPLGRDDHAAIWTGDEMIIWGGFDDVFDLLNSGGRYHPDSDTWLPTEVSATTPSPREGINGVWTGTQMIIWGGAPPTASGGLYCACPNAHTVYRDADGDGFGDAFATATSGCDGAIPTGYVDNSLDCDDTNPLNYPNAPEINDGIDNQCPGDPGYGSIDELGDSGSVAADKVTFSWAVQQNATSYQMARATTPDFTIACTSFNGPSPTFQDAETPLQGTAFYYIARATAPFVGSWGKTSAGTERTTSCP